MQVPRGHQVVSTPPPPIRLRSVERSGLLDADDPLALELRKPRRPRRRAPGPPRRRRHRRRARPGRVAKATAERSASTRPVSAGSSPWPRTGTSCCGPQPTVPPALTEPAVLPLVTHLETPDRGRAHATPSPRCASGRRTLGARPPPPAPRPDPSRAGATPGLTGADARSLVADVGRRPSRSQARALPGLMERIEDAPRSFVLPRHPRGARAAQRWSRPPPKAGHARVAGSTLARTGVDGAGGRPRPPGLLAMVSGVLAGRSWTSAGAVATWLDGAAVEVFEVRGGPPPWPRRWATACGRLRRPLDPIPCRGDRSTSTTQLAVAHRLRGRGARPTRVCSTSWPPRSPRPGGRRRRTIGEHDDDAVDTFELVTATATS